MKTINKFFCLFCCLLFLSSCSVCETTILETKKSPDSKYYAYIFEKNCGATTKHNRHISITDNNQFKLKKGNVFVMEGTEIEIDWISSNELKIIYSGDEFIKKDSVKNIKIEYQKK